MSPALSVDLELHSYRVLFGWQQVFTATHTHTHTPSSGATWTVSCFLSLPAQLAWGKRSCLFLTTGGRHMFFYCPCR